jgi:hypothetical protein
MLNLCNLYWYDLENCLFTEKNYNYNLKDEFKNNSSFQ